ncbi:MAG: sugar transferase [Bacteroidales bacterium]|nr:sugar transferase [Bacteroidales bacterium]
MGEVPDKISVLYIGDNPVIIERLTDHPEEITVYHQDNGLKAIDWIKKNTLTDVIVSDYNMAGIKGPDLGIYLKQRLGLVKVPFILIAPENDHKKYISSVIKQKTYIEDLYPVSFDFEKLLTRMKFLIYYLNELKESESSVLPERSYKIPFIKRLFDIVVSFMALLVLSPFLLLISLAIRLESKGAVIYKSKRVGTGYRIFDFYKFRSMYTGADMDLKDLSHLNQYKEDESIQESEPCPRCLQLPEGTYCSPVLYVGGEKKCEYWYSEMIRRKKSSTFVKIQNDPRITKVGKFIRNTSIDELPQLINVLKGDMSIVGNRPLPLYEAELLTSDDWSARFLAPAGITGLWQVKLRGKGGKMSEEERKSLDNEYAQNYSFWSDIRLILSTIPALFQKENV